MTGALSGGCTGEDTPTVSLSVKSAYHHRAVKSTCPRTCVLTFPSWHVGMAVLPAAAKASGQTSEG